MADQDLSIQGSLPIVTGTGLVDINPISQTRSWFKVNGCIGIFGLLERFCGKKLSVKYPGEPILSIHSNQRGSLFIQTNTRLLMLLESDLTSDEVTDDISGLVVYDDISGQHVIA